MRRNNILEFLNDYQKKYENEKETTARFINFVSAHEDCFERTLRIGHVTGSAWVVNKAGTHVLLTHHRKLNKWLQLGGHADGNSDVRAVAFREVKEESGLSEIVPVFENLFDVDIHLIPQRKNDPAHYHFDVRFAIRVVGSEQYIVSEESHDLAWIEISKLQAVTAETSMLRMAQKWLKNYL